MGLITTMRMTTIMMVLTSGGQPSDDLCLGTSLHPPYQAGQEGDAVRHICICIALCTSQQKKCIPAQPAVHYLMYNIHLLHGKQDFFTMSCSSLWFMFAAHNAGSLLFIFGVLADVSSSHACACIFLSAGAEHGSFGKETTSGQTCLLT